MLLAFMPPLPSSPRAQSVNAIHAQAATLRPVVRALVASVLREAPGHADVEDCTHETMRRALENRDQLRDESALRAWVLGIARHVALDAIRARRRERAHIERKSSSDDTPPSSARLELADTAPGPYERLAQARRDEIVRRAMRDLPDGPRNALTMFHVEGLGYQEIAARLDVPLGTVATWVNRGRKAIASIVEAETRDA
jgi:RNA polymerase sigma factor (sigma-70 family)